MDRYLMITIAVLAVIFSASIVPSILYAEQEQAVTDCRGRDQECTAAFVEEKLFGFKEFGGRKPYVSQPQSPSMGQVATPPPEPGPIILTILFQPNSDRVSPESKDQIEKIVTAMTKRPGRHVWIEGHTDSDGPANYNVKLSRRRAQSVKEYILHNFPVIPPERLIVQGYGKSRPMATNDTEDGKRTNRRVEFASRE